MGAFMNAPLIGKPTLLLVDDEERILRSLSMLLRPQYKLHATTDAHAKPWDAAELRSTVQQAAEISLAMMQTGADSPAAPVLDTPDADGILVMDHDPLTYAVVQEIVGPRQPVYWGRSLDEGFEILASRDIAVIVSELIVGRENLAPALKMLKAQHPEVVTLVLTPFQDVGVLVDLINQGQVYRFLPKPARKGPLSMSLASALKHHQRLAASPVLTRRHSVEPVKKVEDAGMAARVMGYLSRLRGRALPSLR